MVASVQNPTDLVNLALARIGYQRRIGNLFDGSAAASKALTLYAQTRDALLCELAWGFAERNTTLTLLKAAPTSGYIPPTVWTPAYPVLPWRYEYAYPSDCLQIRSLRPSIGPIFNPDPQPILFSVDNDASLNPPQKVILTNLESPVLVYTGQVTDPLSWDSDFSEAFAAALGRRLAPALVGMDGAKFGAQDEAMEKQKSQATETGHN